VVRCARVVGSFASHEFFPFLREVLDLLHDLTVCHRLAPFRGPPQTLTRRRAFLVSGLLLRQLLSVPRRTEDDVRHFVDVRDRDRVRGALDLHDLAGLGPLSHEAVHL